MAIRISGSFTFPRTNKLKLSTTPSQQPTEPTDDSLAFITEEGEPIVDDSGAQMTLEEHTS